MPAAVRMSPGHPTDPLQALGAGGLAAARAVIRRVRRTVEARLLLAALFGSRARGDARPDSDVDLLLVFDRLPPDREPQATHAEWIAEDVAVRTGVPVSVWSVSRIDLHPGRRTPMLVDALEDAVPLWPAGAGVPRVRFTPRDAFFCTRCLLERVAEGSGQVSRLRRERDHPAAARRARDDLVRLCTAVLLAHGITRPRDAAAVAAYRRWTADPELEAVLRWAERSFEGVERVSPPPSWSAVSHVVEFLRKEVLRLRRELAAGAALASRETRPAARAGPTSARRP